VPRIASAVALVTVIAAVSAVPAAASAVPAPPPITILTPDAGPDDGAIFVSPFGGTDRYANGPQIVDGQGRTIWFHPVPAGQEAADFRTQTYRGQPVLTWWQGTGLGGAASGVDYVYDRHYRPIVTVRAGNGYTADGHEFLITPWNTALILAYAPATADLTAIGGPASIPIGPTGCPGRTTRTASDPVMISAESDKSRGFRRDHDTRPRPLPDRHRNVVR
jgi:hypothetical protein